MGRIRRTQTKAAMNKELTQTSIFLIHLETEAPMRNTVTLRIICSIYLGLYFHR